MYGEAVMMWEKQAVAFFQPVEGGCHSEEEATAKWTDLVAKMDDPGVIKDRKGPPKKPLRFAIRTRDLVNNVNRMMKTVDGL